MVRNIMFWEGRVLQNLPQKLGVSSKLLLPPELIWGSPYARGLQYHLPLRGPIRLTNFSFHTHVQYCRTIHYHSCRIDKIQKCGRSKMPQFWKVKNIPFWEGRTSQLRSIGPKLVPLLASRCHYWGVHLTKGWPNVKLTWCSTALGH